MFPWCVRAGGTACVANREIRCRRSVCAVIVGIAVGLSSVAVRRLVTVYRMHCLHGLWAVSPHSFGRYGGFRTVVSCFAGVCDASVGLRVLGAACHEDD